VPTLYGAADTDVALAESLLHLSPRRRRTVPYERLRERCSRACYRNGHFDWRRYTAPACSEHGQSARS
jgi:hypothetical protein